MAYKDSETLQAGTSYALEEYSFNCIFDDSPTLGTYARASMTKDGQTVYKTVSLPNNAKINGWTVEANDDTADIYAVIEIPVDEEATSDISHIQSLIPIAFGDVVTGKDYNPFTHKWSERSWPASPGTAVTATQEIKDNAGITVIKASSSPVFEPSYTYKGKTVYYSSGGYLNHYNDVNPVVLGPTINEASVLAPYIAWTMIYGDISIEGTEKEILVGRFAIDLEDAGGVGPGGGIGGGWTDPGDYDEDWEAGDPTHTLYVTVTGALSGRHNDPIEDSSYSYIPADKDTVKDYGCGGDGGHGGGGGAGASTVVVHKFATNQANSKEVTALARRHGYGSGGGKGGKGGDGCILIYY